MIALLHAHPYWPLDVEHAVAELLVRLPDDDHDSLRSMAASDLVTLHFGLGLAIRNEFGLLAGNTALLAACGSADMHPDSASAVIIRALWEYLRNE
jgi:hypothetical protein